MVDPKNLGKRMFVTELGNGELHVKASEETVS